MPRASAHADLRMLTQGVRTGNWGSCGGMNGVSRQSGSPLPVRLPVRQGCTVVAGGSSGARLSCPHMPAHRRFPRERPELPPGGRADEYELRGSTGVRTRVVVGASCRLSQPVAPGDVPRLICVASYRLELQPRRTYPRRHGHGARRFIIGLGGSAINDAGAGMATAVGARFLDADGNELPRGGAEARSWRGWQAWVSRVG